MNKSSEIDDGLLLRTADLAARTQFKLGEALVNPGTRTVKGPGGEADLEPRVMQVLVVLADAAGSVVTRETLFQRCWGNVFVGDDSLNRAIAVVRRTAASIAADSFIVETVPRTGYQLIVKSGVDPVTAGRPIGLGAPWTTRRAAIAGAALIAAGGGGIWWIGRQRATSRVDAMIARGQQSLRRLDFGDETRQIFEQAVAINAGDARAWGGLALTRSMTFSSANEENSVTAIQATQDAVRKALSINPKEPNALLAMFELQGATLDWLLRDKRLREIIAIQPDNVLAISELVGVLQSAGLNRESWDWNERVIAIEPLVPESLVRRALKHWIAGRIPQADKTIDQVRILYPSNGFAWWAQLLILATTERPAAALAMLEGDKADFGTQEEKALWRPCLIALDLRTRSTIGDAKRTCVAAARVNGQLAAKSVMILSALGEVDTAFQIANGFLLRLGPVVGGQSSSAARIRDDIVWRNAIQWLFTPPVALMRRDPRFVPLCDAIGLSEYWRARGVPPDYLKNDS